jgi:glycosyltransferase involved in cell wall biosynthesis
VNCVKEIGARISVIIPTLNEANGVAHVIREVRRALPCSEIIVVDGDSSDGTPDIAKREGAKLITVTKRGYGAAIKEGIRKSSGEFLLIVDGDGTYDLSNLEELVKCADQNTVVVGCRFHSKPAGMGFVNFVGNFLLSLLFRVLWFVPIKDSQSGLKLFPKKLGLTLSQDGMEISTEILVNAKRNFLRIKEVQIPSYRKRLGGSSKLNPLRDGVRIALFVLKQMLTR